MSKYWDLVEAYHKLFFEANQLFEKQLDVPIVFDSRVEGEAPLIVSSISSLYKLKAGVRLSVGDVEFMKTYNSPGWACMDGRFVEHSEVFLTMLKVADKGGDLTISR